MKNILLVDDDQICNFLSTKALEKTGDVNDIHTAANGQQAINLFENFYSQSHFLPDVVLLDLNMPVMNGFEFLKAFQQMKIEGKDNVRIIIVSSSVNPEDISRAKSLGASDYVSKPLTAERLKQVLCAREEVYVRRNG
jgi:CheY-like chemotaxis protein